MNHVLFLNLPDALLFGASVVVAIVAIVIMPRWSKVLPGTYIVFAVAGWNPESFLDLGIKIVITLAIIFFIRWRVLKIVEKPFFVMSAIAIGGGIGFALVPFVPLVIHAVGL